MTATDPSLSSASITVNITVTDEDDAATVTLLTGNGSVDYPENGTEPVGRFDADDQDDDATVFSKERAGREVVLRSLRTVR